MIETKQRPKWQPANFKTMAEVRKYIKRFDNWTIIKDEKNCIEVRDERNGDRWTYRERKAK